MRGIARIEGQKEIKKTGKGMKWQRRQKMRANVIYGRLVSFVEVRQAARTGYGENQESLVRLIREG